MAARPEAIFFKFPHTPHLLWLGEAPSRADKVFTASEVAEFLSGPLVVEEKVDGANLGLSVGADGRIRAQSRGQYLNPSHSHSQWDPLWPWLAEHRAALEDGLHNGLILFGEWCYARHSLSYDTLPDWFLGFDLYDQSLKKFWSSDRRDSWLRQRNLHSIPVLFRGVLQKNQIAALIGKSKLRNGPMEGVYLRREVENWLLARAKVVSTSFQQQIAEHWTRHALVPNRKIASPLQHA